MQVDKTTVVRCTVRFIKEFTIEISSKRNALSIRFDLRMLLLVCNERTHYHPMSNSITQSSSKSDIIDAACELISIQEDDINSNAKHILSLKEEKLTLIYLFITSTICALIF